MFVDNKILAVPKSDMFELVMHVPINTVHFASSKCRDIYFWAVFMWMKITMIVIMMTVTLMMKNKNYVRSEVATALTVMKINVILVVMHDV